VDANNSVSGNNDKLVPTARILNQLVSRPSFVSGLVLAIVNGGGGFRTKS
jgi:hypothetical protein